MKQKFNEAYSECIVESMPWLEITNLFSTVVASAGLGTLAMKYGGKALDIASDITFDTMCKVFSKDTNKYNGKLKKVFNGEIELKKVLEFMLKDKKLIDLLKKYKEDLEGNKISQAEVTFKKINEYISKDLNKEQIKSIMKYIVKKTNINI